MRRDTLSALFVLLIIGTATWVLNHNTVTETRDEILLILTLIPAVVGVLSQIKNVVSLFSSNHTEINPTSNINYSGENPAFLRVPNDFITGFVWHRIDDKENLLYATWPSIHKYLSQYRSGIGFCILFLFMGCILFIFTKYLLAGAIVATIAVFNIGTVVARCFREQKETIYAVSNCRIFVFQKLDDGIYRPNQEVPFEAVLSVGYETNALGRALGVGNIIVRTLIGRIEMPYVVRPSGMGYIVEYAWSKAKKIVSEDEKRKIKELLRKKLNLPENKA